VERTAELSTVSRVLTWAAAVAFALLGAVLFVAPAWSAGRFAWSVSEFVTMTIGGWCLGTAWVAAVAARTWRWPAAGPALLYLWSFSILESLVLVWFRSKIVVEALSGPYFVALGVGVVAAVVGVVDLVRLRLSPADDEGPAMRGWIRALVILFEVFVGGLVLVAAFRPATGAHRRVFPEPLTPFTVRAFGAFYLALVIGAAPILWAKTITSFLVYLRAGLGLVIPITVAAFVYIGAFDMPAHPVQAVYLIAYLLVGVLSALILVWADRPRGAKGSTG
jgi:hypothetical protein